MSKETAVFAYAKDTLPTEKNLSGKAALFTKLRDRGVEAIVSLGAETAFADGSIEAHELIGNDKTRRLGRIALEKTGVLVNRMDRSMKKDRLADETVHLLPPSINENRLRSLVYRKVRVQDEILDGLGLGMPTTLISSEEDVTTFVDQNPTRRYMVKPNSGTNSRGIARLKAGEIIEYMNVNDRFGKDILQPAYDFTLPLASSVRPYDKESREGFKAFNRAGTTKELRLYGFTGPRGTVVFPVARAVDDGDRWFFVDPDSLPASLAEDAEKVLTRAAVTTGSKALYGALDMGYGSLDGDDPDYHVIELNGRAPYMIGYDKHAGVADTLRDMFADQIKDVITNQGDHQ